MLCIYSRNRIHISEIIVDKASQNNIAWKTTINGYLYPEVLFQNSKVYKIIKEKMVEVDILKYQGRALSLVQVEQKKTPKQECQRSILRLLRMSSLSTTWF